MQSMWREGAEDRPDFRAVVLSLAALMHYDGNIESDLRMETRNCRKEHLYHELDLSALPPALDPALTSAHDVLEEPLYLNYSREDSLDSPEEYEVPRSVISADGVTDSTEIAYEIPVTTSCDAESVNSAANAATHPPLEYETPMVETNDVIPNGVSSGRRSPAHQYKLPTSGNSPQETPHHTPTRHYTTGSHRQRLNPNHSPHRSPAHQVLPSTGPIISIPGAKRDELRRSSSPNIISPGYLKLNYPAMQKPVSNTAPDSDEPYSTLEWKKGKLVSDSGHFNSLPSRSKLKSHIYQTLEPKLASQ